MITALSILVRIIANPFSNVLQKLLARDGASPTFVILATHLLLSLACLPAVALFPWPHGGGFWSNMALCACLAVASNGLLVQAMKLADLSVLGPINAYKAVVSLLPGMLLLGETPRPLALGGIGLIIAGSYFLGDPRTSETATAVAPRRGKLSAGVWYRLAALVLSAVEAVFLKRALLHADAETSFIWWSILGCVAAALVVAAMRFRTTEADPGKPTQLQIAATARNRYLLLAVTTGLMQYCTLVAFAQVQVAAALALFQTSSLVSVLLGHRIFREPHLARRLTGTAVMIAGAVLIIASRP